MTSISTKVGMALITVYWIVMGGMAINLYYHNTITEKNHGSQSITNEYR